MYQTRLNGICIEHTTLEAALKTLSEKVSFTVDGHRVILRADGTWEVWTKEGVYTADRFRSWLNEVTAEELESDKSKEVPFPKFGGR